MKSQWDHKPVACQDFSFLVLLYIQTVMGSEARSLLVDEAVSLGRVVMVVILGDDGRNSFRGTAFHEVDHPGTKKHRIQYPFWEVR